MSDWFGIAIHLALVTGQRREDLVPLRFDHIEEDRLLITQGKTGAMISVPMDLELKSIDLKLAEVVGNCRWLSSTNFMLNTGLRKNSVDSSLHADGLTKKICRGKISGRAEL